MRAAAAALTGLAFLAAPLSAHQPAAPPETAASPAPTLAFDGGRWFDGEAFVPATWYSVDGRLTAARPDRIDARIDLSGRYLLPGLIEAHNHDAQNGRFAAISNGKNLRAGIFHSVQMCSRPGDRAEFGGFLGRPGTMTVLYADACISSSDGHPLGIALASARQAGVEMDADEGRRLYDPIDTIGDLERLWPEIAAREPELIKIILINSERREQDRVNPRLFGFLGLDPALARPIVERAHGAGIRVVAHADSAEDFAIAVTAGADIIAHLPGYRLAEGMEIGGYRISDAAIAEAARRGTVVITTAGIAGRRPDHERLRSMQVENLARLRAAGVPLAIGSDNVMGTVVDEILYLDSLGIMPRAELLRRATADTAASMFPGRPIGAFREGAEANLVAYDADPIRSIETLRSPSLLVQRGSLLSSP